jgi:hypothetical protein
VALASFALAGFTTLALAGTTKLCNRHGLVEFGDRAEHLTHQLGRGGVIDERAGTVCRDFLLIAFFGWLPALMLINYLTK